MTSEIVSFDLETTGLQPKHDHVIQLSAVKFNSTTFEIVESKNWYIRPSGNYTISPAAQATHGITKEFLDKNGISLDVAGREFLKMIEGCDILTYNGNRFDVNFLYTDLKNWGINFNIEGKRFYDSFGMECRFNPRDLGSVYKKYMGKDMENAHNALADVNATIAVFKAQLEKYNIRDEVDTYMENNIYSPEGSIRVSSKSGDPVVIVMSNGKYKDSEFMSVCEKDPQYIKWFMENVASEYTKAVLRVYYKNNRKGVK